MNHASLIINDASFDKVKLENFEESRKMNISKFIFLLPLVPSREHSIKAEESYNIIIIISLL